MSKPQWFSGRHSEQFLCVQRKQKPFSFISVALKHMTVSLMSKDGKLLNTFLYKGMLNITLEGTQLVK